MIHDDIDFLPLQMDADERAYYEKNKITVNKQISAVIRQAEQQAKLDKCIYCGTPVTSFCNSHSVPQFCLRRIAVNGKLLYANSLIDLPYLKEEQGVKQAGTFQIICKKCDSRIFQQYEDPTAYDATPTGQVLAQIAMKDHLQMIAKRLQERELYRLLATENLMFLLFGARQQQRIIDLDLGEHQGAFMRAKVGAMGKHNNYYKLVFYRKLGYTVPVAFQGDITMISDLEGKVINDTFNTDNRYSTESIHIAIFPLETESVVFAFVDSRCKRYRKFEEQLKQLELDDQLATILYIVMSYSENVFYSKTLSLLFQTNEGLAAVSRKNSAALADRPDADILSAANIEYDLSGRSCIPNLLLPEYAV